MESRFDLRRVVKNLRKRSPEIDECRNSPHAASSTSPNVASSTLSIEKADQINPLASLGQRKGVIEIHDSIWPWFDPGSFPVEIAEGVISRTRDAYLARWARHEFDYGNALAHRTDSPFLGMNQEPTSSVPLEELPKNLYDLDDNKLVQPSRIGHVEYVFISHVWGDSATFDGRQFGLDWPVQIRDPSKLEMIFHAARAIAGKRYIWMDVLCMDQRPSADKEKRAEIANMGSYLRHAVGSLVWLDNAYGDAPWNEVLSSIRALSAWFKMDHHTVMMADPEEVEKGPYELFKGSSDAHFERLTHILRLEQAPWFRRVWTLQEGVIPKKVFFCTPERYMVDGHMLWSYMCIVDIIVSDTVRQGGIAVQLNHLLQKSEIFKMMQLRHLYRTNSISIWHIAQAIRTRWCTVPNEAMIGAWALLSRPMPQQCAELAPEKIFWSTWVDIIEEGDLTAAMNFGLSDFLWPELFQTMNIMAPQRPAAAEKHELRICLYELHVGGIHGFIQMKGVGIERPQSLQPLQVIGTAMSRWKQTDPGLRMMTLKKQLELSEAFDLHEQTRGKHLALYPSALAIITAIHNIGLDVLIEGLQDRPNFFHAIQKYAAQASLRYYEAVMLAQIEADWALVLISDEHDKSHLAIVTESVGYRDEILLVMPSSYQRTPGKGCLVCKRLENGTYKKIGLGLGRSMSAKRTADIIVHP